MFSFISRIPYQNLTLFSIGILVSVFIGFFITEHYISSDGVEEHTKTANCFVDYLRNHSITDGYFETEQKITDDEDLKNCNLDLKHFYLLEDIETNLYTSYDTSQELCKEIKSNETIKLCLSKNDVEGSEYQSTDNITCINVNRYLSSDEISIYETSESFYVHTRNYCDYANSCYTCIRDNLNANENYMLKRLYARAIQLTYIKLEFWKYLIMWSKVEEIYNSTRIVEDEAKEICNKELKCFSNLDLKRKEK